MKTLFYYFLLVLFPVLSSAQITFKVCDVPKAETALSEQSYRVFCENIVSQEELLETRKRRENQDKTLPDYRLESYSIKDYNLIQSYGQNQFLYAIRMAYADHRPLVISPDMIWLLILQGFAEHVHANSEALRSKLVYHEGRKVLFVRRDDYVKGDTLFPWPEVFQSFSEQMVENVSPGAQQLIQTKFSTTGPTEKAAFEITMMDALNDYFLYVMGKIVCGIPEITLEGTPEDWKEIEEKTKLLTEYDLKWWTDQLAPILHEFTLASQGTVDRDFWKDIFILETPLSGGCGVAPVLNGWVLQFFPYLYESPNPWVTKTEAAANYQEARKASASMRKDPALLAKIKKEVKTDKQFKKRLELVQKMDPQPGKYGLPALEISDMPNGIGSADLLVYYMGPYLDYAMISGFFGVRQDSESLALRPEIGWLIMDKNQKPPQEDIDLFEAWWEEQE